MRATTCEQIEELIEREALGWSEADRLRVEQHLGDCEACRETLAVSRFVRETLRDAAGELSDTARTRAIQGALDRGRPGKTMRPTSRRVLGASAVGLSLAAAAGLILVLAQPDERVAKPEVRPSAASELASAPSAQPGAGPVEAAPPADLPAATATIAETAPWIEASSPEQHRFAHAEVELAANTRARFDAAARTLELDHGRVDVDVDASKGLPFAVETQHFRVEVLGTRFVVTPSSVSVKRGRVQVFGRDGSVLARELAAGGSYHYGSVPQGLDAPSAGNLGVRGGESKSEAAATTRPEPEPSASAAPVKSAALWLREAREALGRGDTQGARTLVSSAEASAPTRGERAEGNTVRAEAALLERDPAAALSLYRDIGQRYADLAAGDNAAFAAAQLAARADKAHERELLEAYLARYPNGRFRDEAKQRLERLGQ